MQIILNTFSFALGLLELVRYIDPPVPCVLVRSEEHTSELQSRETISYAVFCLKKKNQKTNKKKHTLEKYK